MDKAVSNGLFISGTGTCVGKTVVSSLLFGFLREQGLEVGYQKWLSTGGDMPEDLLYCLENNNMQFEPENLDKQVIYRFQMPASPHLAAARQGVEVEPERIKEAFYRYAAEKELLLVEGVGGLLVPLRNDLLLADFLSSIPMPTLLVAASGLGTINHTLMSLEVLKSRSIPVLGVVFSDEEKGMGRDDVLVNDNMRIISEIGGVDVFGRLPRLEDYQMLRQDFVPIGEKIWQKFSSFFRAPRVPLK